MTSSSQQHLSHQVRAPLRRRSLVQKVFTSLDRPGIFGSCTWIPTLCLYSAALLPDSCDTYPSPPWAVSVYCSTVQLSGTQLRSGQEPFLPSSILFPSSPKRWPADFAWFLPTIPVCFLDRGSGRWRGASSHSGMVWSCRGSCWLISPPHNLLKAFFNSMEPPR